MKSHLLPVLLAVSLAGCGRSDRVTTPTSPSPPAPPVSPAPFPVTVSSMTIAGNTAFTASPWAANGKIFALSEDGDAYVFAAGPEFKLRHKNSLDEMCMATPAIAGDRLLIRTLTKLYCFR